MTSDAGSQRTREAPRLLPGQRLASQVCSTNVIVLQTGDARTVPECGGLPMVPGRPVPCSDTGQRAGESQALAGTIYEDVATGLIVRCTISGPGRLTLEGRRPLRPVLADRISYRTR